MALTDENGSNGMVMPVQPIGYNGNYGGNYGMPYPVPMYYGNNGNDFGGDGAWLILFIILAMSGSWGGFGGFGGFGGGFGNEMTFPWLLNGQQGINANTNAGFNQAATASALGDLSNAVTSGFSDAQLGIAGVNQNICQTGANITSAVTNGFAQAEIAENSRQMANMQQIFNLSSQLSDCCCENRLATANLGAQIAREACSDRETVNNGVRDLLVSGTSNTQSLLNAINGGIQSIQDKLCQQELDAERRENQNLRTELLFARGQASQTDQTATIQAGQRALANEVEQFVNPTPIPAYVVQNPNCCTSGCGCSGFGVA